MPSQTMERLLALRPKLTPEEVCELRDAAHRRAMRAAEEVLGGVRYYAEPKEIRARRQERREWETLAGELEELHAKLTAPLRKARRSEQVDPLVAAAKRVRATTPRRWKAGR